MSKGGLKADLPRLLAKQKLLFGRTWERQKRENGLGPGLWCLKHLSMTLLEIAFFLVAILNPKPEPLMSYARGFTEDLFLFVEFRMLPG